MTRPLAGSDLGASREVPFEQAEDAEAMGGSGRSDGALGQRGDMQIGRRTTQAILLTLAMLAPSPADARASLPGVSLYRCENTVRKEADKLEKGTAKALAACLQTMAKAVVQNEVAPATAAPTVAAACVKSFHKLNDSRGLGVSLGEKMSAAIAAKCDPNSRGVRHALNDVTGKAAGLVGEQIDTANIDAWCGQFGGDGSIDTVAEWIGCLQQSHECAARVVIASQYPRALEWLDLLIPAMGAMTSPATDPTRVADAVAAATALEAAIEGGSDDGLPGIQCGSTGPSVAICGDGVRGGIESCDGTDLGGATCTGLGFLGGPLGCALTCGFDTSACLPDPCGDGVRGGIESCDGTDLGGETCISLGFSGGVLACTSSCGLDPSDCTPGFPATGQTTCWNTGGTVVSCAGTGHDGDVQAGATLSYTDKGDGTINDNVTGLMWEKKSDDGSLNDKDTLYNWANAFAVHIAGLNGSGGYAGHVDWRLPNAKELQSIVNLQNRNPSVSAAFDTGCAAGCTVLTCSCTTPSFHWSSTTNVSFQTFAWYVNFSSGATLNDAKTTGRFVRAVRGGA